ncbi:macrophage mannose receptor 1-like [Sycon ciliatum]|uniref:macrophage mannose receptor 1-like n=1 Tax=Sycon ciliatum TaxID=27933 RepID=UPI0031F632A5
MEADLECRHCRRSIGAGAQAIGSSGSERAMSAFGSRKTRLRLYHYCLFLVSAFLIRDVYSQTCSPGWTAFQGTCYIFFRPSPRVTWPIAVQICGFFNGHLVNIASQAENDFVLSLANRDPWIGINDRNTEGDFRWEDTPNEIPPYLNFADVLGVPDDTPPGEDCGVMFTGTNSLLDGLWNDESCENALKDVVCEQGVSAPPPTIPVPTTLPNLGPCPVGWTVFQTTCFKYFDSSPKVTWPDARQACINEGGHLADLRSAEENAFAHSLIVSDSWIGYNDLTTEGVFQWDFTGDSGPFTNWNLLGGEPNDRAPGEDCVVMYFNIPGPGEWNDDKCELVLRDYLCEQGFLTSPRIGVPDTACPPGWFGINQSCYLPVDMPQTFPQADLACTSVGGFLASIQSEQENADVHSLITADSWIGYNDRLVEDTFVWVQGVPTTYTNWFSGAPDNLPPGQDCALMYFNSPGPAQWNDQACGEQRAYVCERARVFVTCNSTHMGFHVARGLLRSFVEQQNLHLNDPTCRIQADDEFYFLTWRLDECGNTINFTNNVDYTQIINFVQHTPTQDGITRFRSFEVKVICLLLNLGNSSAGPLEPQGLELNTSAVVQPVVGFGDIGARLSLTDDSFASLITVYPHQVTLNDELFFRIRFLSNFGDLMVFARRCYATPFQDPFSTPQHDLIIDHCPVDSTVVIRPATMNLFRFSVRAFQFVNEVAEVFIHCEVQACPVGVAGSRCSMGCQGLPGSGGRKKRQASATEEGAAVYPTTLVMSQGPLVRKSNGVRLKSSTATYQLCMLAVFLTLVITTT